MFLFATGQLHGKDSKLWSQGVEVRIMTLFHPSCVTLDNFFNFLIFHLKIGDNNNTSFLRLLNELIHVKYPKHYLTHSS